MDLRWNAWNLEKVARHGVRPEEVEVAVRAARPPWPESRDNDKWMVWGGTAQGRLLQVIYPADDDETAFVIHARPLTDIEKKRYRRRRR